MKAVVIGGHTRNIGKTSVMATLIRELAPMGWTAVKITQYGHGLCSLDGEPCECAPNEHAFALTEETNAQGRGDTCRYLAAGARRSLWLRVREGQLAEALPALEGALDGVEWVMLESNSIVEFIDPVLYLVVMDGSRRDFKPSAHRALARADALIPIKTKLEGPLWPGLNPRLLSSKPAFPVREGEYWSRELADFVRSRLLAVAETPAEDGVD